MPFMLEGYMERHTSLCGIWVVQDELGEPQGESTSSPVKPMMSVPDFGAVAKRFQFCNLVKGEELTDEAITNAGYSEDQCRATGV